LQPATGSLIAALILSAVYVASGRFDHSEAAERLWMRRRWISAAAGVSVAYVFIDVLPEFEVQRRALVNAAGVQLFAEQRLYLLALLSFVVFYGLEHVVLVNRQRPSDEGASNRARTMYLLHIAGYAAYSALIGYLVVERADRGALALAVYAFAMALHFLIVDHSLDEAHGAVYARRGRAILAASVLLGWLCGTMLPLPAEALARLFAILAGGVVITSLHAELPDERTGRFWPFCLGAVGFAAVLLMA